MASFIDCYSSISDQISKIYVNPQSYYLEFKDNQQYFKKKLDNAINILTQRIDSLKSTQVQYTDDARSIKLSFIYDTIYLGFDIFSTVHIDQNCYQILLTSTLLKNGIPYKIKDKDIRLSINRYLMRVNAILKYGSLVLNPLNGQLVFNMNSLLSLYQFQAFIYEPMRLVHLLQNELLKSKHYIRMHIYKILYLTNDIGQLYVEDPALSIYQVKGISNVSKVTINMLGKIMPFLHLQFPFMYNDHAYSGVKSVSPDIIKRMNETIKTLKFNSKVLQQNCNKAIESLTLCLSKNAAAKSNSYFTFTDDEKKELLNILLPPFVRHNTGQPPYVYSEIQIKNDPKQLEWENIDQGGFGMIRKANIQFVYKRDREKYYPKPNIPFKRVLVKKDDFERVNNKSKLSHEKQILNYVRHSISPFIAKFFFSQQAAYHSSLFVEYCPQKSFLNYRQRNSHFMTLGTKLIFLKYIAQAIKFLKDHKICHLDLKLSNILFGNGHIKIIDFGEAFHPDVCQKSTIYSQPCFIDFRPGTSLPYAPPESFSHDQINFSDRLDVFSFGTIMHQILFDCYPIECSKINYNHLKKAYSEKTYQNMIIMAPEKIECYGFKRIYGHLTYVILRCLQKEERKRPCIEWIVMVLQCCISLEQHLYFW